jgi:hypothetical protein
MSRKVLIQTRVVAGVTYGRVVKATEQMSIQDFAHEHIEMVTRDLLMKGGATALVSGFDFTLTTGLGISLAEGHAVDLQGRSFQTLPTGQTVVSVPAAHASLPRIDLIFATLVADQDAENAPLSFRRLLTEAEIEAGRDEYPAEDDNVSTQRQNLAVIGVRQGTADASPTAPATGANEVPLFQVRVNAGVTTLVSGNVTDVRIKMRSLSQALVQMDANTATIGALSETIDDRVAALLRVDPTYLVLTYDDVGNLLHVDVNVTAFDARYPTLAGLSELVDDRVAAMLTVDPAYLVKTYDDTGNLLHVDVNIGALDSRFVNATGDTVNGNLFIEGNPTNPASLPTGLSHYGGHTRDYSTGAGQTVAGHVGAAANGHTGGTAVGLWGRGTDANSGNGAVAIGTRGRGIVGPDYNTIAYGGYFEGETLTGAGGSYTKVVYGSYSHGHIYSPNQGTVYGAYCEAAHDNNSGTTAYGVYGTASGAANNYAGYFAGNVQVTGSLSKGSGTFLIDHPVAPAEKDLVHGFVESSEYLLVYRVKVKLVAGAAQVDLDEALGFTPGTFARLTQDRDAFIASRGASHVIGDIEEGAPVAGIARVILTLTSTDITDESWVAAFILAARADAFIRTDPWVDSAGRLVAEHDKAEPTAEELAALETPVTESVPAGSPVAGTTAERLVPSLVGKKGFPRHAEIIQGTRPMQTVRFVEEVPTESAE